MYTPWQSVPTYSVNDATGIQTVFPRSLQAAMLSMSREQQARVVNEARMDARKQVTLMKTGRIYYHGSRATPDDEWIPDTVIEDCWTNSPLKVWRELRGMSRDQLAKSSGVPLETIAGIEKREIQPDIETLNKFTGPLDCELDNLTSNTK